MRIEVSKLLLVILVISIQSCHHAKLENPSVETINIGSEKGKAIGFTDVFSAVHYIPLETTNTCLIGGVYQFSEFDDHFFILDQKTKQVFVFNSSGKFLNKIGRQGKGPGEFLYPKQFIINETKHLLYLYDSTQKKIIRYNFDGSFINEIQVNAYLRSVIFDEKSDTFWAYIADLPNVEFNTKEKSKPLKFIKIDQQGNIIDYTTGENSISFRLEFSYIMLKQSNESVLFVEPLNESVFNFDGRHIATKYKLDFGERTAPTNVKKALNMMEVPKNAKQVRFFEDALANYFLGFYRFLANKDWLFFSYQHQRHFEYIFYNKKSKVSMEISAEKEDNGWDEFFMPSFMDNVSMFAVVEPKELLTKKTLTGGPVSSIPTFGEEDNPIIVKYVLK